MKPTLKLTAVTVALLALTAPAFANDQLAASAGLTPEQAAGMTLNEIAAVKYNRDHSYSDRQTVGANGDNGNEELLEFAIDNYNSGKGTRDRQTRVTEQDQAFAFVSTGSDPARSQLIAQAGLTPDEAAGMTLSEIVAIKHADD